jgi:serine protease
VAASPSSIDFGSFQSSAVFELGSAVATGETVASVASDNANVTLTPGTLTAAGFGRYTVAVNRAAFAPGSHFPRITVTLSPARTLTVQLSITQPGAGAAAAGNYGPLYVLLVDPATQDVVTTVIAQRSASGYTWSAAGVTLARVSVVAGGDLDNDGLICQRGEPCGAYPVLAPSGDLSVIELGGSNRGGIDFQVAPLSGMSVLGAGAAPKLGWPRLPARAGAAP